MTLSHHRQRLSEAAKSYGQRLAPKKTYFRVQYVPRYANDLFQPLQDRKDEGEPLRAGLPLTSTPEPRGLWWHVICGKQMSTKATVRNYARRRVRDAFRDALLYRGFDRHGLPVLNSRKGGHPPSEGLVGSMLLHVHAPVLNSNLSQLDKDVLSLVDSLMAAGRAKKPREVRRAA